MTATIQRPWGADGQDVANNAPNAGAYGYLANMMGADAANVITDARGWVIKHTGGMEEVLVCEGGLKLPIVVAAVTDISGVVHKAAGQVIAMRVQLNVGVDLGSANAANIAIRAISND